jgi:hypothetical protein
VSEEDVEVMRGHNDSDKHWRSSFRRRSTINDADFAPDGVRRRLDGHEPVVSHAMASSFSARRSLQSTFVQNLKATDQKDWVIDYTPVKFDNTDANQGISVISNIYRLDIKGEKGNLTLKLKENDFDYELLSPPITLLDKKERFSKNQGPCHQTHGETRNRNICVHYYKLSKVCLIVDEVPWYSNTISANKTKTLPDGTIQAVPVPSGQKTWQITRLCGTEHNHAIHDSTQYLQEIGFLDSEVEIEVRSAHDPHWKFGLLTRKFFELDPPAGGQIAAGSLLLLFATCMLGMASYKTYRFCIKYTLKDWRRS